jgi:hypothetical protein
MLKLFKQNVRLFIIAAVDRRLLGHIHLKVVVLAFQILQDQLLPIVLVFQGFEVALDRVYFLYVVQLILFDHLVFK